MRKLFSNSDQVQCIFGDEGITFCGTKQDVFMPFGCIDTLNLSLLGILQATSRAQICTFAVDRKDRAEIKALIKEARVTMKTAPRADLQKIDHAEGGDAVSPDLPPEEQLRQYKALFIQGVISREAYEIKKTQLKG